MRIIFMGTPDIAVPSLNALVEREYEIAAVVTQPDKEVGRGKNVKYSPVKERALELGIPVLQPVKVRTEESLAEIRALNPDLIVVIAFGQILPKALLEIPPMGCVNIHASLLPMYRGAAPIQQVLLDGCTETGITTMMMDVGLDTGDLLLQKRIPIAADETGGSLFDKLSVLGAETIVETIEGLLAGTITPMPQAGESCYAGMLSKEMGEMDWTQPAEILERRIRALYPWPGAYTFLDGKRWKLFAARILENRAAGNSTGKIIPENEASAGNSAEKIIPENEAFAGDSTGNNIPENEVDSSGSAEAILPGTVVDTRGGISVMTGDGILQITELQAEGKKRMGAEDFLRGVKIEKGTVLGGGTGRSI